MIAPVVPKLNQREHARVQDPLGHEMQIVAYRENGLNFCIDLRPIASSVFIDHTDQAIASEAGILGFEIGNPLDRFFGESSRLIV